MIRTLRLYLILLGLGLCWGLTVPLGKIAVSTGHDAMGLVAWQSIYMTLFLTVLILLRGARFPLARRHWLLYAVVALAGTVISNTTSLTAAAHLPAGVMSIIIALVPMFALPLSLALRLETWAWARMGGVVLGAVAVGLLVGPEASLPEGAAAIFVLVALIAPFFYAVEGNYLAWRGTGGLDPLQVLWGASVVAVLLTVPMTTARGEWVTPLPFGAPEAAILAASFLHGIAYVGYIWTVGKAGAVFAAQVAYLVTAAGVIWSMLLLGESYSGWVWLAFVLMLTGVALVQPRPDAVGEGALPPEDESGAGGSAGVIGSVAKDA